ncbi:MAG: GNAT family N-acetyltransferase [Clostridia bacterium]|nr:GNAT family N-acetyltransferase [Clostridia bacterium]
MIEIKKISSKRDMKKFVKFPTNLYKDNPNYIPPIELDEFNLTNPKKNASFEESEAEYYLALDDGKVVGRIAGIISHAFNTKNNAKYARISRFDAIDNDEVAKKLIETVENWAKDKGMEYVHGPLGFNDLEREGLMTYGFDTIGTFQGSYNADYYEKFFTENGYKPDCKWVEWRIQVPDKPNERVARVAENVSKRFGFYEKKFKNKNEIIDNYGKKFFELLDECFVNLYGTIPFNQKLVDQTIGLFKLVIDPDYVSLVFNKEDELIGFGLGYPSLARAMQKSKGRFLPFGWARLLHAIKHPKTLELGLIAVKPEYQKKGVTSIIINNMLARMIKNKITYCDTGCQLETNTSALAALDMFEREIVRRKTCFVKKI